MKKLLVLAILIFTFSRMDANAQSRKAVSAAEVNGTFRSYFGGKFKGSYNEIKILALGKGRLRVSFGLIYPYVIDTGEMSANMGEALGEATIEGDTAIFTSEEFGRMPHRNKIRQVRHDSSHAERHRQQLRFRTQRDRRRNV